MGAMASVRTDEPLPPNIQQDRSFVRNNGDPVDTAQQNPLPCQPLVVCLRFLGVELDPASILNQSSKCYFRYLLLGLCFLLLNAFFTIFTAVVEHNLFVQMYTMDTPANYSSVDNNSTVPSIMSWNLTVDYVNYGVLYIGVHASLFVVSRQSKWKLLWNNVQQILQNHNEFKGIRKLIRRVTIAGLLIACLETLGIMSCSLVIFDFDKGLTLEFYFRPIANFFYFYATCGLLLFAIIGWTVALGFRSLHQELLDNSLLATSNTNGCPETVSLAEKEELIEMLANWKRLYVLLIDTADGINDCLGPVLLIWVAHIFVGFIAIPFYILDGIHFNTGSLSSSWVLLIMNFCLFSQHLFHLLIITAISSRIWHEAAANGKLLQKVNLHDFYHLQDQVNMLTTEVFLSLPRITAMEYADLDFSLIPTVIGTSLTYLIILCQFQSSEQ